MEGVSWPAEDPRARRPRPSALTRQTAGTPVTDDALRPSRQDAAPLEPTETRRADFPIPERTAVHDAARAPGRMTSAVEAEHASPPQRGLAAVLVGEGRRPRGHRTTFRLPLAHALSDGIEHPVTARAEPRTRGAFFSSAREPVLLCAPYRTRRAERDDHPRSRPAAGRAWGTTKAVCCSSEAIGRAAIRPLVRAAGSGR